MKDYPYYGRQYLGKRGKKQKPIDMDEVYAKVDQGYSVGEVAQELGVARCTLYRCHKRYQAEAEKVIGNWQGDIEPPEDDLFKSLM